MFGKKQKAYVRIEQRGVGITPETGYWVYKGKQLLAQFCRLQEARDFIKNNVKL